MLGCLLLYCLPDLWPWFAKYVYPWWLPWLLPVVQISMMTSIYCTIVMSFERYIRICHLCQLRNSRALTEENFWWVNISLLYMMLMLRGCEYERMQVNAMRIQVKGIWIQVYCNIEQLLAIVQHLTGCRRWHLTYSLMVALRRTRTWTSSALNCVTAYT